MKSAPPPCCWAQEKPTPTGTFPITQKDQHHVSNLYDAPMPYMLRLTNDRVTIHATNVRNGYASHGCIGCRCLSPKLFGEAHLKDKVYITRGKQVGLGDSLSDYEGEVRPDRIAAASAAPVSSRALPVSRNGIPPRAALFTRRHVSRAARRPVSLKISRMRSKAASAP
jgi:hypothetical protein